jgi:hypothetical protein
MVRDAAAMKDGAAPRASGAGKVAAWLGRPADAAALGAFLLLASGALTLASRGTDGPSGAAAFVTLFAEVALGAWGGAWVLRAASLGRVSLQSALVASTTALAAWVLADRIHRVLFGSRLEPERLALLYEALRSGALKADATVIAPFLASVALVAIGCRMLLAALAHVRWAPWIVALCSRHGAAAAATMGLWVVLDPAGTRGAERDAGVPWAGRGRTATPIVPEDRSVDPFGRSAEEAQFARLGADTEAVLAQVSARRRPNIVIVHVESLRSDMLNDAVMPSTTRMAQGCLNPARHYSTSNNTGSGMFGILTGLPVSYYALARREGKKPLPLRMLARLGYTLSAYYSAYLESYDGLTQLFFDGVMDHVIVERNEHAEEDDKRIVERYVSDVYARDPATPTFDYVVLESSHYDYTYPPAFEKFVPTATLGVGIRDGYIVRPGINEELKPRAPFIRNRYQNSLLWVDSLIKRMAEAWAARSGDVVVVVTGDHGESFWEHCGFGHGDSLCEEQTRVPLVMCMPGAQHTRYTYTSHADVLPTIFDFMGVSTGGLPTMCGKSLLSYEPSRDVAVVGYGLTGSQSDDRLGVAGDGIRIVFVNRPPFPTVATYADGAEAGAGLPLDSPRVQRLKLLAAEARVIR